ncbi:hypothetical protein HGRIS_001416 [Hohenbuehelia grisea]|uniref:HAT C-terminal dimerisation domain-containing protein n=1 Tax=Hohenbuehelia grisea TaxID=104357 RepID=A0ABR3JPA3_9AGAR
MDAMDLKDIRDTSQGKRNEITAIWRLHGKKDPLAKLAQVVHSVVANSAGAERYFSRMGIVHTKLRNRLNEQRAHKTAAIAQHLRQQRPLRDRKKRKFGSDQPTSTPEPHATSSADNDTTDDTAENEDDVELLIRGLQATVNETVASPPYRPLPASHSCSSGQVRARTLNPHLHRHGPPLDTLGVRLGQAAAGLVRVCCF